MTEITVKLNSKELDLLIGLATDQLFRREFIDSRLPGSKPDPEGLKLGKKLAARLRVAAERANKTPQAKKTTATT